MADLTKEGAVLCNIMNTRVMWRNQNLLCVTTGKTGSGKSYANLRIAELWYRFKFKKEFPPENICFTIEEAMTRLVLGNLKKGDLIIIEEAGTSMGALDFQSKVSRLFNYVLQSFRNRNIIVFLNLPFFTMLNKTTRMLMHLKLEMISCDREFKLSKVKPLFIQVNQMSGKIYYHFPKVLVDGSVEVVQELTLNLPSENLRKSYEEKKDKFVMNLSTDVLNQVQKITLEKEKKLAPTPLKSEAQKFLWEQLQKLKEPMTIMELGRKLNVPHYWVSQNARALRKKGYAVDTFICPSPKLSRMPIQITPITNNNP